MSCCVSVLTCLCGACGIRFEEHLPANYELVQFRRGDGRRKYLPVYGEGGYLDMLARLVEGWTPEQTITKAVSRRFCEKLSAVCGDQIGLFGRSDIRCPQCGAKEIEILKTEILPDFPVEWLEIPKKRLEIH